MAFEKIYGLLLKHAVLTESHKQELIQKRGFSDETIKRFRLGSGGAHLESLEEELQKEIIAGTFREQEVVHSGVFVHDGKHARLNPVLLRTTNKIKDKDVSNILIPYFNDKDEVYLVRPHKLGFKDVPSEVYHDWNLRENPSEIIITEGEFKAIAGMQYGFPTIAVPGVGSFSENKFPLLIKTLKAHKVQRIIIVFDNETKDDPNLPRYKPVPNNRYDTEFYTYYMAQRLEKDGAFDVAIATIPDGWKDETGKIDLDGCAAALKTQGEMKKILYDAVPRSEYLHDLSGDARQIVLRKMQQKYHRAKIQKHFNRYVVMKNTKQGPVPVDISNFVMRVVATHDTPEGVKREVEFTNEFGRKSSCFTIPAEDMTSGDSFRTFAMNKGDFVWRGTTDELLTIWESEFLTMEEGRYITESDHIGWIEKKKLWLFGNVAIKYDKSETIEIGPDANGIFWLEKEGIKPIPLSISSGKGSGLDGIPELNTSCKLDMKEVKAKMQETIGQNEACLAIGWISAVPFMEEIFRSYRSFPFFFVTGRWQSGKTTIAEWCANFFGIEDAGKAISQTTAVAIQRSLAYYSCLPFCLDEYRNTKEVKSKDGFLRNVYNRQSAGKGLRDSDFGLRDAKVRGTMIISGEETPKDGALQSRCIVLFVSKANRTKDNYPWFMQNRTNFSHHFYDLIKRKPSLVHQFMASLAEWKKFFEKEGINERTALNYATVVAGHTIVYGDDIDFAKWLAKETKSIQVEHNEEQAISVFLDDLLALKTRKLIDDNYWSVGTDKIYIYFHGLCQVWAQEYRKTRGDEAFKEGSIRAYLKEENGFSGSASYRIKGQMKKCIAFEISKVTNEDLKNLVDMDGALV